MEALKKIFAVLGLSLLFSTGTVLVLQFALAPLVIPLEGVTYDWRYRRMLDAEEKKNKREYNIKGVESGDEEQYGIHIVDIDARSMEKMGVYWGWDRGYQATMTDSLSSRFPAAIAFDILFFNREDSIRYERIARVVNDAVGEDTLLAPLSEALNERLSVAVNYDLRFEAAIARSGRVTLGLMLTDKSNYERGTSQVAHRMNMEWHNSLNPGSALTISDSLLRRIQHTMTIIDGIYPQSAQAARDIGHVNAIDEGSVIRQIPLFYKFDEHPPLYLPVSMRIAATLFGTPNDEITFVPEKYIDIGTPFKVFREEDGSLRFSYPDFTETQLRMILAWDSWMPKSADPWKADVSSYMALYRDSLGRVALETSGGGQLSHELTEALKEYTAQTDKSRFLRMAVDDEEEAGNGFTVRRESQTEWEFYSDNGQFWLSRLDIRTLFFLTEGDFELDCGTNRKLLTFDFWVRHNNGLYTSTLPVLRGKTLTDLIFSASDPQNSIDSIPPGSRRDFGDPARIPLGRHNRHIVTYFGRKSKPFPYLSFYDVMNNNFKDPFAGRIFIVGSTSPALFDIKSAPHDRFFPGVEVHASLLNSIFTGNYMRRLTENQDLLILFLVGFIATLIAFAAKPLWGGMLAGVWLILYSIAALHVFDSYLMWIEMVRPMLAIALAFTGVTVYRYMTEEKNRIFLQDTFKHYLSSELIDKMYYERQSPKLGGEAGVRTAFFTDIAGFSTFSEELGSPTHLVELLNEYLTAMTDILLRHYGTLDKYEGDAIIAFFGAPAILPDHAAKACHTAIEMQKKLGEFRKKWAGEKCDRKCPEKKCGDKCGEKNKWPEIVHNMQMRIGINTGEMITGNMGSATRMNYTMMGDSVNLAARLESAAKQYGISTMISEFTYDMVKDSFETRMLGRIKVVGKNKPVTVYELICKKGELTAETAELLSAYNQGIDFYYKREWSLALDYFTIAGEREPNRKTDPNKPTPSKRLEKSCRDFIENPPGEDWDGVDELRSK